ncbi:MAG: DUF6531 domain-containing protein, partial [Bacteroidota bacterium]
MYKYFTILIIVLIPCLLGSQNYTKPNISGPHGIQVNSFTGNLFYQRSDLIIPGRGQFIDVNFSYNSSIRGINKGYGNGWIFSYEISYYFDSLDIVIERADGRKDKFIHDNGIYKCPAGIFDTLIQFQPNQFKLLSRNGLSHYFESPVHRKLTKIEDRNSNVLQLTYNDSLITSITDASGRTITLNWNNGLLSSIIDPNFTPQREFQYQYNSEGNLISISNIPAGHLY